MTNRLHAHVSVNSRDCDSTYHRSHVEVMNDDERIAADEYNFMNRVMISVASPYACEFGMRVTVDDDGIEAYENTEEGYRHAEVRWCRDKCDTDETAFRDYTAESMGY